MYRKFKKCKQFLNVFLKPFYIDALINHSGLLFLEFILIFENWYGACCFLTCSKTYSCEYFPFSASYKCVVPQCALWVASTGVSERVTSVIEGSSDRRVNWMMDALLWLMGHFYSPFWVWVRSAVSPHLSSVHQSIFSLPHFPVFSPCFSRSFQSNTFSYSTLSYLCLHFLSFSLESHFLFTNDSVSSAALALFSWHLCPFSFCLV